MHVYNMCWKMLLRSWKIFVVSIVVFVVFVLVLSCNMKEDFYREHGEIPVLFINEGSNTALIEQLKEYLSETLVLQDTPYMNMKQMEKALCQEKIYAIIKVDEDFTKSVLEGDTPHISCFRFKETKETVQVELLVERYKEVVTEHCSARNPEVVRSNIEQKLKSKTIVHSENDVKFRNIKFGIYTNYLSWIFMTILISVIGSIVCDFLDSKIGRQNSIALNSNPNVYKETAFVMWAVGQILAILLFLLGIAIFRPQYNIIKFVLLGGNVLVYAAFCSSVGLLIGSICRRTSTIEMVKHIIALGSSALCGVVIEQGKLSSVVTRVSSLLPTYWYVKTNDFLTVNVSSQIVWREVFIHNAIIGTFTGIFIVIYLLRVEKKLQK